jgi:hypothetical protein
MPGCGSDMLGATLAWVAIPMTCICHAWITAWRLMQRNQLHREYGEKAEARCVKRLERKVVDDFETTLVTMTLVYCVPMPQPTAKVQYLKITKDVVHSSRKVDGPPDVQEGAMVPINHLFKHTGNARNMVTAAEMNWVSTPAGLTIGLSLFGGIPLLMIAGPGGCGGVALLPLLSIFIVLPICFVCVGEPRYGMGKLEEVDEQGKEMAMTGNQTVQQVPNPTAMMVPQATAVPIAEAMGDPEIASQDSAAAGYAPPPPPGASTAHAAFARVAAIDNGWCYLQV